MMKYGRSQGHGFVCFSTSDEAAEAIADMNGKELGSKPIYVTLNKNSTTNHRYPQNNMTKRMSYSPFGSRPDTNHSSAVDMPMSRTPPRISMRLPARLYPPFKDYQDPLDTRENSKTDRRYSPSNSTSNPKSDQPLNRRTNTPSNNDED
jgi:RNA recognition motif-containing protein